MCTCNAYTYGSCKWGHCRFESVSTCLQARLGLKECQARIVNGKEGELRAWPVIPGICAVCFPKEAAAEAEEKQQKEQKKVEEATKKVQDLPESAVMLDFPLEAFVDAREAMW
ncbi:hypothetical protein F5Y16DRAFT_338893 [Xylariaceae sp. FL0255]|nr:hypothetical protein F5Y16DRAFT_338893 [Xylariaceae sp. FL0255]